ncbi:hypothetical protein [Actinoplanes sp. CA-252034]|uniref:hypothetical protein n=1 Tax=Actinoplanes sp. CA-252034 TaxID=3239906 RepID=UPI003D956989
MRLRNWIAVLVSVLLLAGAGVAGILVNRSTVQAVEKVHRTDTTALGDNNAELTGQLQYYSTVELGKIGALLAAGAAATVDQAKAALAAAAKKTNTFQYGLMMTDPSHNVLLVSGEAALPATDDAGWQRMWAQLDAAAETAVDTDDYGFSSVMQVAGVTPPIPGPMWRRWPCRSSATASRPDTWSG